MATLTVFSINSYLHFFFRVEVLCRSQQHANSKKAVAIQKFSSLVCGSFT